MSGESNLEMYVDGQVDADEKRTYAQLKKVCDAMADVRQEYINYVERGSIPAHTTAADRERLPHDSEEHHRRYKVMTRVRERMEWDDIELDIVERSGRNALRLECGDAAAEMRHSNTVVLVDDDIVQKWNDVSQVKPRTDRSPVLDEIHNVPDEWLGVSPGESNSEDELVTGISRKKMTRVKTRQSELTDYTHSAE